MTKPERMLAHRRRPDLRDELLRRLVTPEIEMLMARMSKPVGSFGYDPWGYHEDRAKLGLAVAKRLYDHYFRVTATGLENIPDSGRGLLVANHSGQLPLDAAMIGVAAATRPGSGRVVRGMIERFVPTVPWVGNLIAALGSVIGDPLNAAKMLEAEELLLVFPEGVRGSGKPYRERYKLKRFGHGFMYLALKHRAPVIPVGVVGCEETMPSLGNVAPLARLLGIPYLPITTPLPLPARVSLHFGKPMRFEGCVTQQAEIEARVEQVRDAIGELVGQGLRERKRIF